MSILYATIGGQRWPVETWGQVSRAYTGLLTRARGRPVPRCHIVNSDGIIIAHVNEVGAIYSVDPEGKLYDPRNPSP